MTLTLAIKAVLAVVGIYLLQKKHFAVVATQVCIDSDEEFSEQDVINRVLEIGRKISYAQWDKDSPPENVILSPLSIAVILNLLMLGTSGTSNLEIKQALDYPNEVQESIVHETPLTVCVIANVIFLNATWLNQFNSDFTKEGNFYTETETIKIPMMNKKMYVPYKKFDIEGFEMISLPYVGNRLSMYIIKPICQIDLEQILDPNNLNNDQMEYQQRHLFKTLCVNNLRQIENCLNSNDLNTFISQMESQYMNVTIPRMKLNLGLDLKVDLSALGVNEIFDESSADFTRFSDFPDMYVNAIGHKAILEVTEKGTVAAAVTAVTIGTTSVPPPPTKFELNEPSLIFIRDNTKCLILFWGRVMKPKPHLD
ncbi:putative serpin-Z8 [Armadillidium nasatum]|uniref:Putative serpin-Z8 n=1 Tax=Armadillidium nasatum TaxID=96803 RepID=A0A5N5SU57_9CRUS|nr:putative serpin-Z8 [Armadillidium nasatum]